MDLPSVLPHVTLHTHKNTAVAEMRWVNTIWEHGLFLSNGWRLIFHLLQIHMDVNENIREGEDIWS